MFVKTLISGLLVASAASAATIIASDNFGDLERSTQDLPNNSMKWFGGSSGTPLDASSGALVIPVVNQGGAMAFFAAYANRVVLSVDQSLTLKFDITTPATGGQTDGNFAMYLLNSGDTRPTGDGVFNTATFGNDMGYLVLSPLVGASSTRNRVYRRNATGNNLINTGLWSQLNPSGPTPNFDAGGTYQYSLTIKRTADSEALITGKFVGKVGGVDTIVETQRTDTNMDYILAGFDTAYIWTGNNPNVVIDNVEVSFVPEPASMALLGLFSVVARRRRSA